jgi:hypothetical protein
VGGKPARVCLVTCALWLVQLSYFLKTNTARGPAVYNPHLATTVEITCEVNLVKKSCFQCGVLDCLIGLNRSGVFSI